MERRKAALVLSGGGARGVAHIGAIEELESRGFEITAVAGTSMGALVGGMYAAGHLDSFREWFCTLDRYKASGSIGEGEGTRAGTAYRLKDGSMIYVPEGGDGSEAAASAEQGQR